MYKTVLRWLRLESGSSQGKNGTLKEKSGYVN